jgi:hypothetical protein
VGFLPSSTCQHLFPAVGFSYKLITTLQTSYKLKLSVCGSFQVVGVLLLNLKNTSAVLIESVFEKARQNTIQKRKATFFGGGMKHKSQHIQ